jgi:hypothetical protein
LENDRKFPELLKKARTVVQKERIEDARDVVAVDVVHV